MMQPDQTYLMPIYELTQQPNNIIESNESRVKDRSKGRYSSKKRCKQNLIWLVQNYSDSAKCYDLKLKGPNYNSNRNLLSNLSPNLTKQAMASNASRGANQK